MTHFFDDFELGIQPEELDPRENMDDFNDETEFSDDSHLDERFETDNRPDAWDMEQVQWEFMNGEYLD